MEVIVSGLSGSGKSNVVDKIAEVFNLKCVHTSGLLRKIKEEQLKDLQDVDSEKNLGWWESVEGKKYMADRLKNGSFDKLLDEELTKILKTGNVAMDSWTMAYLSKKGFKIWLKASPEVRAKRLVKRNEQEFNEVLQRIKDKEESTAKIYKKLYGFDLGKDLTPFDLVLNTDNIDEKGVHEIVILALKKAFKK